MIKNKKIKRIFSPNKRKVLTLLQAGFVLALTPSPKRQIWILKQLVKEWRNINRQHLYRIIREFKYGKLVDWKEMADGSISVVLTGNGKKWALRFNIDEMKIKKPSEWDGKWRLVFFDIPEKVRKARDALRGKLRELGLYELQKSVFVTPFPCKNEINFIIEFFEVRNYVRYAEVNNFTNEEELKIHFGLH